MSRATLLLLMLAFTGCALTPTQKKVAGIAAGVLIIGAIAAHDSDSTLSVPDVKTPSNPCQSSPSSCR